MKRYFNIAIMSLTLLATATSCKLEPYELPQEELYLRNFINRFGLIDPNQDWNLAEKSNVTLRLEQDASKIVVYANVFDHYYRVARCYNVAKGVVDIPLDIPVDTKNLAIQIDDEVYLAQPADRVDARSSVPQSRADQPYIDLNENDVLGWIIVSEDLGSTDDIDFNDFVARFSYTENGYKAYGELTPDAWDRIDQNVGLTEEGYIHESSLSRDGSRDEGVTRITIKALAAGGVKGIWLHYRATNMSDDYLISPTGSAATSSLNEASANFYEWHTWFGGEMGIMINTGPGSQGPVYGLEAEFEVSGSFSFTSYSQMHYAKDNPMDAYNFDFDRRQIEGFYITVDTYNVDVNADGTLAAFDMGKAIGQCRDLGLPPQMFLIPDLSSTPEGSLVATHYKWPLERKSIDMAYSGFNAWVTTGTGEWYRNPNASYVVTDNYMHTIYNR